MGRVVLICPDMLGGVASYVKNIAAFMQKKGVDHTVVFYDEHDGLSLTSSAGDIKGSTRIRFSKYASFKSNFRNFAGLIRKDDLLICNDVFELEAINSLGLKNRVVFILHGDLLHYEHILNDYRSSIDKVFCVSRGLKEKYSRLYPELPFSICHPLVNNCNEEIVLEENQELTGIFVGRFEYMKGGDVFTEVVEGCIENRLPVRWRIFVTSKGSDSGLLAGIPASVEVSFDLPNKLLLEKIGGADILLFPSRSEGFGMTVLEAMKRGIVPIARNLPIGIPDMVVDGESGYLADEKEQILRVIRQLSEDRGLLKKMKGNAIRFSTTFFDAERLGENFLENVNEVLRQPPRGAKHFSAPKERLIERILPEPVYRVLRWMNSKILSVWN